MSRIYSVADALPSDHPPIRIRPFLSPHHTISHLKPSRRRHGNNDRAKSAWRTEVLFLDEFYEYGTKNLEALRQPLEDRIITISTHRVRLRFPPVS